MNKPKRKPCVRKGTCTVYCKQVAGGFTRALRRALDVLEDIKSLIVFLAAMHFLQLSCLFSFSLPLFFLVKDQEAIKKEKRVGKAKGREGTLQIRGCPDGPQPSAWDSRWLWSLGSWQPWQLHPLAPIYGFSPSGNWDRQSQSCGRKSTQNHILQVGDLLFLIFLFKLMAFHVSAVLCSALAHGRGVCKAR